MNILIIAPHPDDEVLGVGGTIAKRSKNGDNVFVCVVTKGKAPLFSESSVNIVRSECVSADKLLGVKETLFLDFPAAMLENVPRYKLNSKITEVIQNFKPHEVYIPHWGDMQLDHQMIVDAAMVGLRPKYPHRVERIYAYETPSETGWNIPNTANSFIPNVYEDITDTVNAKLDAMRVYESQLRDFPEARSIGMLQALARYRGATVGVCAAEAFTLVREIK